MRTAFHARIRGAVQGVGYRFTTVRHAQHLGIEGWVRNDADGSVEVFAQGTEPALEELRAFLETGPTGARVAVAEIEPVAPDPGLRGFEMRW